MPVTPYIGQLMLTAFNYAPKNFATCNGQTLSISANQALFSLLGTTFGGDGRTTFLLPNLQGRTPVGVGANGIVAGQPGGEELHILVKGEVPPHTHALNGVSGANTPKAAGNLLAGGGANVFAGAASLGPMSPGTLLNQGGSQPHENRQPFLVMNWCIALNGIYPSRS